MENKEEEHIHLANHNSCGGQPDRKGLACGLLTGFNKGALQVLLQGRKDRKSESDGI